METKSENRAFEEMRAAAVARLKGYTAEALAARAGAELSAKVGEIIVRSLGQDYALQLPDCAAVPDMAEWHYLVLLHYLELSDGASVSSEFMSFGEMRDGLIRGTGFDRSSERTLSGLLAGKTEAELQRFCAQLGGTVVQTNADFGMVLPFFPRLKLQLKVWYADDEFPASGKLLIGKNADHCLTVEDAVTVGETVLAGLAAGKAGQIR